MIHTDRNAVYSSPMPTVSPAVFVLGQDENLRTHLCSALRTLPWPVSAYARTAELTPLLTAGCILAIEEHETDLVLLLSHVRRLEDRVRLILLTAETDISSAVAALRGGVYDLIELPVIERELHRRVVCAMGTIDFN